MVAAGGGGRGVALPPPLLQPPKRPPVRRREARDRRARTCHCRRLARMKRVVEATVRWGERDGVSLHFFLDLDFLFPFSFFVVSATFFLLALFFPSLGGKLKMTRLHKRKEGRIVEEWRGLTSKNGNYCYDHNHGYHPASTQTETRTGSRRAGIAVDFGAGTRTSCVVIAIFRG